MAQAVSEARATRLRPRWDLWGAIGLSLVAVCGYRAMSQWRDAHAFLINRTDSLPNWAFVIHKTKVPLRGDHIFFIPPQTALVRRHFGARPQPFGKIVYGLPGDVVSHDGSAVAINGKPVARMKPKTRLGEPLIPGATGPVPAGCYYVGTPHKDGFDSRYAQIGFVCARQIIGTGVPIL